MEGGGLQRKRKEGVPPDDLADLREGEILCDRHRRECYQVAGVDEIGIALHREGAEFYIPCSLFVNWYGRRLFPIEGTSIEAPDYPV